MLPSKWDRIKIRLMQSQNMALGQRKIRKVISILSKNRMEESKSPSGTIQKIKALRPKVRAPIQKTARRDRTKKIQRNSLRKRKKQSSKKRERNYL